MLCSYEISLTSVHLEASRVQVDVVNTNALRQKYPDGPTLSQWFQQQFDQLPDACNADYMEMM
jgi:hypothetical protein